MQSKNVDTLRGKTFFIIYIYIYKDSEFWSFLKTHAFEFYFNHLDHGFNKRSVKEDVLTHAHT